MKSTDNFTIVYIHLKLFNSLFPLLWFLCWISLKNVDFIFSWNSLFLIECWSISSKLSLTFLPTETRITRNIFNRSIYLFECILVLRILRECEGRIHPIAYKYIYIYFIVHCLLSYSNPVWCLHTNNLHKKWGLLTVLALMFYPFFKSFYSCLLFEIS